MLGFFSRSSSELLLEVVDEDGGTNHSARSGADGRDGLVAVWPKASQRGKQRATRLSGSKEGETW
jgi:hypothetical protein